MRAPTRYRSTPRQCTRPTWCAMRRASSVTSASSSRSTPSAMGLAGRCTRTSGGAGNLEHLAQAVLEGKADAVLAASIFHFGEFTVGEAKQHLKARGIEV